MTLCNILSNKKIHQNRRLNYVIILLQSCLITPRIRNLFCKLCWKMGQGHTDLCWILFRVVYPPFLAVGWLLDQDPTLE